MMIMAIWWSKATRLLEFSRSSVNRNLRHEEEVGPGFFVTEDRGGGIGHSSKWISNFVSFLLFFMVFTHYITRWYQIIIVMMILTNSTIRALRRLQ